MEPGGSFTPPNLALMGPWFMMPSEATRRLFWTLNGPLESSIQVAPSPYFEPDAVMEPYYCPATNDAPASWHPVSQENLYTNTQQTVKVGIQTFATYQELWSDLNWEDSGARWAALAREDPDFDPGNLDPDLGIPICPIRTEDYHLTVTAAGDYLTIHEYVSAVHPWLMSIRKTLLEALWYTDGRNAKWTSESKIVVVSAVGSVHVGAEEDWIRTHRQPREPFIGPTLPRDEGRRRRDEIMMAASRERIRAREEAEAREALETVVTRES